MERSGLIFQQGADDFDAALAGRENRTARQVEGRILGVIACQGLQSTFGKSEYDAPYAGPINRAGAHRARFCRRVKRGTGKDIRVKLF